MKIEHKEKYKFSKHPMIQSKLYGKVFRKDEIIDMLERKFVNPFAPNVRHDQIIDYFESAGLIEKYNELIETPDDYKMD